VYIKIVAVKKLVVGRALRVAGPSFGCASALLTANYWTLWLHLTMWCCVQARHLDEFIALQAGRSLGYASME